MPVEVRQTSGSRYKELESDSESDDEENMVVPSMRVVPPMSKSGTNSGSSNDNDDDATAEEDGASSDADEFSASDIRGGFPVAPSTRKPNENSSFGMNGTSPQRHSSRQRPAPLKSGQVAADAAILFGSSDDGTNADTDAAAAAAAVPSRTWSSAAAIAATEGTSSNYIPSDFVERGGDPLIRSALPLETVYEIENVVTDGDSTSAPTPTAASDPNNNTAPQTPASILVSNNNDNNNNNNNNNDSNTPAAQKVPGSVSAMSDTSSPASPLIMSDLDTSVDTETQSQSQTKTDNDTDTSNNKQQQKKTPKSPPATGDFNDEDSAIELLTQNNTENKTFTTNTSVSCVSPPPHDQPSLVPVKTILDAARDNHTTANDNNAVPAQPTTPNFTNNAEATDEYHHHFDPFGKKSLLVLGQFDIDEGDPLHYSQAETLLSAVDHWTKPTPTRVVLKLMKDSKQVKAELDARDGLDPYYVVPVQRLFCDRVFPDFRTYDGPIKVEKFDGLTEEWRSYLASLIGFSSFGRNDKEDLKKSGTKSSSTGGRPPLSYPYVLCLEHHNRTLEDVLAHDLCDLSLVRRIIRDIVVALILLHTEKKIHGDIKPRSIVRVGTAWKLTDFQSSCEMGSQCDPNRVANWGYCPPEVATTILEEIESDKKKKKRKSKNSTKLSYTYVADPAYDLWSLGCILYHLVFGSSLWNIDRDGKIPTDELKKLSTWCTQCFLKKAYYRFPPEQRTDDQKAVIDLISKLLLPTPDDRRANFAFGIISVHQHEFLEGKALEHDSLHGFEQRQGVMLQNEEERVHFHDIVQQLTLEEQWELNRARDVLMLGIFELTDVHTPTSFVILNEVLPEITSKNMTDNMVRERLDEGMGWVKSFDDLGPCVRGALNGDMSAVGHFWMKINGMYSGDHMYFYFIDELTGEPVRHVGQNKEYPVKIKTRSDLLPKLLPLMQLTMRSVALYHGVAGILRMFGGPPERLTEEMRENAQDKVNELKHERSASPFGTFADDVRELRSNKEQYLKKDNIRCRSLRELVRFLVKKFGQDKKTAFVGLNRLADDNGRAIWTTLSTIEEVKEAIKNRAEERLMEERSLWDDTWQEEIRRLQGRFDEVTELETALNTKKDELEKANDTIKTLEGKVWILETSLANNQQQLASANRELEIELEKAKCMGKSCVIQ